MMKNLVAWLRAIARWFGEFKPVWWAIAVVIIVLVVALSAPMSEPKVRICGLVLEALGLGTVVKGVAETREFFGHPSALAVFKDWIGRFPFWGVRSVGANLHISLPSMRASMTGRAVRAAPPGATVEQRLAVLEENFTDLQAQVERNQINAERSAQKLEERIKREEQERVSEDTATRKQLESSATGGVVLSAIGVLWILVGLVLSTASQEIVSALQQ